MRHKISKYRTAYWAALSLAFCVAAFSASAAPVTPEDPLKSPGWVHFYDNEYDLAVHDFESDVKNRPADPNAYNHLAQAVLYREMFHNGALESQLVTGNNPFLRRPKVAIASADQKLFQDSIDTALRLAQTRLASDKRDNQALYAMSVTYGLRANYEFLVDKAWSDALHDATESRKYSNRLLELQPGLIDAYLIQGLHDYVVGSLPFYLKMVGFLAGFHGDRDKGLSELQDVAAHGVVNKYDAQILLAVIYRRERRPADALPLLKQLAATFPGNYLLLLEQVQMYSDAGDKKAALAMLAQVEQRRAEQAPGYKTLAEEKVQYLRGNLLFWYGDVRPALTDMKAATARADELDLGTAVLAWLRLGQLYDLSGNHHDAVKAYRETMRTAPDSAAASEAKGYISSPYKRKSSNG